MSITRDNLRKLYNSDKNRFDSETNELRISVFDEFRNLITNDFKENPRIKNLEISLQTEHNAKFYAVKETDDTYTISIGYDLMKYMLVFSEISAKNLIKILKNKESFGKILEIDLRNIIFKIFLTMSLFHELAHIMYGHTDFNSKESEYRRLFESEADSFSFQNTFFYIIFRYDDIKYFFNNFSNGENNRALMLFGYISTYYFDFLDLISNESEYHPNVQTRRFATMMSNEYISKNIEIDTMQANMILLQSFSRIHNKKLNEMIKDLKNVISYTITLDDIKKKSGIQDFVKLEKKWNWLL